MELELNNEGGEKKEPDNLVIYQQNIISLNRKRYKCYLASKPHQTSSHMYKRTSYEERDVNILTLVISQ